LAALFHQSACLEASNRAARIHNRQIRIRNSPTVSPTVSLTVSPTATVNRNIVKTDGPRIGRVVSAAVGLETSAAELLDRIVIIIVTVRALIATSMVTADGPEVLMIIVDGLVTPGTILELPDQLMAVAQRIITIRELESHRPVVQRMDIMAVVLPTNHTEARATSITIIIIQAVQHRHRMARIHLIMDHHHHITEDRRHQASRALRPRALHPRAHHQPRALRQLREAAPPKEARAAVDWAMRSPCLVFWTLAA